MKIACVLGPKFEDSEFKEPYDSFRQAGHQVTIVGLEAGQLVPGVEMAVNDGGARVFDIYFSPLIDDDGSIVGTSLTFMDVTQMARLRSELERSKQDIETAYEELQSSNGGHQPRGAATTSS